MILYTSMESTILALLKEIESLENDLNILLKLEDPVTDQLVERTSELAALSVDSLRLRLEVVSLLIKKAYEEANKTKQKEKREQLRSTISVLIKEALFDLFLKLLLSNNCNLATASVILKEQVGGVDSVGNPTGGLSHKYVSLILKCLKDGK